jgi:hypothetical protein
MAKHSRGNNVQKQIINPSALAAEAESSEHKEAYKLLYRNARFRIGSGARITSPNNPTFFLEILIHLTSENNEVDMQVLEKTTSTLKELQARNFKTTFQDNNCISCEAAVAKEKLKTEYEWAKTMVNSIFET